MKKPILILGASGHARVLIDILKLRSAEILGILDANPTTVLKQVSGVEIIGDDSKIKDFQRASILLVNAIGSVHVPWRRKQVFERFKELGYEFATLIHPSAIIAEDVSVGEGAQVMAGAVIQTGSVIGADSIINTRTVVDHDCTIGNHVHISPGATLSGNVTVMHASHVGAGAVIIQGKNIGSKSVIGAGAVVISDVPDDTLVTGVPAKIAKKLNQ